MYDEVIRAAMSGQLSDEGVAELAVNLAASGFRLERPGRSVDLASTGGPGSLSTLFGPLCLRALGVEVRTLGVPGRPAGGIDVLARLPGYRVELTPREVNSVLDQAGYVHMLASEAWAPADARLFVRRQAMGAQSCPPLVIASLLSKKLALGLSHVGLDVRVAPHGNFGQTDGEAQSNAERFERVARLLDVEATCFLSDGVLPAQPFLGRGEALVAVQAVLEATTNNWLTAHIDRVWSMAATIAGTSMPKPHARTRLLRDAWTSNLTAQGCSPTSLANAVSAVISQTTSAIRADRAGRVTVNLALVRDAIVAAQHELAALERFPDPCGVTLLQRPGASVESGVQIARVRTGLGGTDFLDAMYKAIAVVDHDVVLNEREAHRDA